MTTTIKKKFTSPEILKIQKMRNNGMAINKIAKELHRSKNLISLLLKNPEQFNKVNVERKTNEKKEKMVRVDNDKSVGPSEKDIKNYNRVLVEHRAVIKYLTKKGIGPRFIYEEMRKVYGPHSPTMTATLFWCSQFKQGRLSITNGNININNTRNKSTNIEAKIVNKNAKNTKKNTTEGEPPKKSKRTSDIATTANNNNNNTAPEKKLLKFKFGVKRLEKSLSKGT